MKTIFAILVPLALSLPGLAAADPGRRCNDHHVLKGRYVFSASGFTRPAASAPGSPWVPKAIVEVLLFNGDGTLTTPAITIANPFGDSGTTVDPPSGGAPGLYTLNEDCTGTVQFQDAAGTTFKIVADAAGGEAIWMIQTHPVNNVLQGKAVRVGR